MKKSNIIRSHRDENNVELYLMDTKEGYAVLYKDLDAGELIGYCSIYDYSEIELAENKYKAELMKFDTDAYFAQYGA